MILMRNRETGYFTEGPDGYRLTNVHDPKRCMGRGCAIHGHPGPHPLREHPLNWRVDRGILERICDHGVGHPDADAVEFQRMIGQSSANVHGCCGCCGLPI